MTEYAGLTARLDALLRETYALWEPGWVIFNWRNYTYDHVQRVRGLALTLCREEGGDPLVTELAALLHDITKPYDGDYLTDASGQRVVDADGLWRNVTRWPVGRNRVTDLYDRLHLAGQVHNASGAALAEALLAEEGVPQDIRDRVARTIRHHLIPPAGCPVESACLYDADTIDANVGLPAFVRNIYINLHFYDARKAPEAPPIAEVLQREPLTYLRPYITENLPRWNAGKRRDFTSKLLTAAARRLALARHERLERALAQMSAQLPEIENAAAAAAFSPSTARVDPSLCGASTLAVVLHYMRHADEPSIAAETEALARAMAESAGSASAPAELLAALQREMAGDW